jgi:hypothetical protein
MGADKASIKAIDKLSSGVYEFQMLTDIPKKPRRSSQQNSYYFAILSYLVREVDDSYDKDFFHYSFKCAYFGIQEYKGLASPMGSTTKLSTAEMSEFIQMVRDWAYNNMNLIIPTADEWGFHY